jgi:CheY-like chemotaxis protein
MAQMQERLDHANKERDEAVALARAKETAATGISNEILNPINAIRTVVGLVADEDITDEIREYCEVLKISADSLAHTANEVLGYEEEDIDESNVRSEIDEKKLVIPDARILLVDDNKVSLRVAKALINLFKPEIVSADNAYEAIDRIRNGEKFDLIFMDHLMPGMDGIECFHAIREQINGSNNDTPVIILTANAGSDYQNMYIEEGFNDYVLKPVKSALLEKALVNVLPDELVKLF